MAASTRSTSGSSEAASGQFMATMTNKALHHSKSCYELLKECEMFSKLPEDRLKLLVQKMEYKTLQRNQTLLRQGDVSDKFYLLESGEVRRRTVDANTGKIHNVEFAIKAKSINSMRVISGDPVVSDAPT